MVLEASSQWDEGTRAVSGSSHAGYGTANLGYDGKLAIHPTHIPAINQGFTPSREQIESDRRVIAAVEASEHGVVVVDGRMIDKPVVEAARRRVRLADQFSEGG